MACYMEIATPGRMSRLVVHAAELLCYTPVLVIGHSLVKFEAV